MDLNHNIPHLSSALPASPTIPDLSYPVWRSAYHAAHRGYLGAQATQVATHATRHAVRAVQDMPIRPVRVAFPSPIYAEAAMSRKQALAATAPPRINSDIFSPSISVPEPFFFTRSLDFTRGHEAGHQATVASALEVVDRASRMMRSKTDEVLEQMERHERMIDGAFGLVEPDNEPVPGLDRSLIRPLAAIHIEPPRDEIVADLQERASAWLETFCPKAISRMSAAHDALLRGDEESMSHAVSSCRRALTALADVVEPPAPGTRSDHTGQERRVGRDEYKNRLLLHLEKRVTSKSGRKMSSRELDLLVHWLDALVDRLGKGVHDDSHYEDAAHIYYTTWGVIAEVVRFSDF